MIPSWPYLHTLVNHFPIVLTVVGALTVLLALLYSRRGLWLFALGSLVLAGLTVYPAWVSGEKAAGAVRHAWYIAPGVIRDHAEGADITLWVVLALGVVALVAWATVVRERAAVSPARWLRIVLGVLSVAGLVSVSYTGYRGGQIVVDSSILAGPAPAGLAAPVTGATATTTVPPAVVQPVTVSPGQPLTTEPAAAATPMQPVQPVPQPPVGPPATSTGATSATGTPPRGSRTVPVIRTPSTPHPVPTPSPTRP